MWLAECAVFDMGMAGERKTCRLMRVLDSFGGGVL